MSKKKKMKRKKFDHELKDLQIELVKLQEWVKYTGAKVCVLFEGRDTAGKGGVINPHHRTHQPARLPYSGFICPDGP